MVELVCEQSSHTHSEISILLCSRSLAAMRPKSSVPSCKISTHQYVSGVYMCRTFLIFPGRSERILITVTELLLHCNYLMPRSLWRSYCFLAVTPAIFSQTDFCFACYDGLTGLWHTSLDFCGRMVLHPARRCSCEFLVGLYCHLLRRFGVWFSFGFRQGVDGLRVVFLFCLVVDVVFSFVCLFLFMPLNFSSLWILFTMDVCFFVSS